MTPGRHSAPNVTLRPMRASDLDRITELEIELFGMSAWSYSALSDELGAPGRWYVVAQFDEQVAAGDHPVVGYAGLWFDGDVAQIMTIGVAKSGQHLGIGTKLMDALIDRAIQLRAQAVLLEVAVTNEPAIAMYTKYGFESIRVRKRYYQPENLDAYVMRKLLETTAPVPADPIFGVAKARGETAEATTIVENRYKGENVTAASPTSHVRDQVFITADQLARELDNPALRLIDVRWQLGVTNGRERYETAHIPGALYGDLDTQLAAPADPAHGRHPLPELADFQQAVRGWGITPDSEVVVYDAVGGTSAARLWWLLRWAGVDSVRILDGGITFWEAQGRAVESGVNTTQPSTIELDGGHLETITAEAAGEFADEGILIDARASERFRGEVEPVDPRAGHIPGAINVPTFSLLGDDQRVRPWEELISVFEQAGVIEVQESGESDAPWPNTEREIAVYCGSGVTASHEIAVLASLGIEAALYPGSWSQWSNDATKPAWTGE